MELYAGLPHEKKLIVNKLYGSVVEAINPDDPTGHVKNCGYTEERPDCDCFELGQRVMRALVNEVAKL